MIAKGKKNIQSFQHAFKGLFILFRDQQNAWIHLLAAIGVIVAGFFFGLSTSEWILVVFAIGFVFSAELFNSAIEEIVNLISPEYNKKAGLIKDLAAAAVLISAITAAILGGIIFIPKIFGLP